MSPSTLVETSVKCAQSLTCNPSCSCLSFNLVSRAPEVNVAGGKEHNLWLGGNLLPCPISFLILFFRFVYPFSTCHWKCSGCGNCQEGNRLILPYLPKFSEQKHFRSWYLRSPSVILGQLEGIADLHIYCIFHNMLDLKQTAFGKHIICPPAMISLLMIWINLGLVNYKY